MAPYYITRGRAGLGCWDAGIVLVRWTLYLRQREETSNIDSIPRDEFGAFHKLPLVVFVLLHEWTGVIVAKKARDASAGC